MTSVQDWLEASKQELDKLVEAGVVNPAVSTALEYERALWTEGSIRGDPFYRVDASTRDADPGTLLKTEEQTDLSGRSLPPGVGMSRIIYQSRALTGRLIPTSASILWPMMPRTTLLESEKVPLIVWAHGTTGIFAENAPSHYPNLELPFLAPYPLVSNGYAVLAPDYAGLGVPVDGEGQHICHEYLASPAHANDVVYSVQAAQSAFEELSKHFAVVGHSQGGGAAWAVAQRQAEYPIKGYLGALALSPVTDMLAFANDTGPFTPALLSMMTPGLVQNASSFTWEEILTPLGMERMQLWERLQGALPVGVELMVGHGDLIKPGWHENLMVRQYLHKTRNGGQPLSGPLLVIHGEADAALPCSIVEAAVIETRDRHPESDIHFLKVPQMGHDAPPFATQPLWLEWIRKLFDGGGRQANESIPDVVQPRRNGEDYKMELDWYVARSKMPWHMGK